MATLKINLKNNFFESSNGRYLDTLEPTKARGNGWKCSIEPDGSVVCECSRNYSDGLHSIRYIIQKNGFAKLTLKTPRGFKLLRKGFVTPRGVPFGNGTLGLAGGNVDSRYAYYRDSSFQEFLNRFGITAVKLENPNRIFSGFSNRSGLGTARQKVVSDGRIEWSYEDRPGSVEYFNQPGCNPNLYSGTVYHAVSGSTWAIVETDIDYRDSHSYSRILYTEVRDVTSLEASLEASLS